MHSNQLCLQFDWRLVTGDKPARLLSGMLIRELQKQAAEAFQGQASQVWSAIPRLDLFPSPPACQDALGCSGPPVDHAPGRTLVVA